MVANKSLLQLYDYFDEVLDCIKVGVFITDKNGHVVTLNKESEKTGGMSKEELIGRSMHELVSEGYCEESSALSALASGEEESIIQKLGDGGQLFITGTPVKHNGEVKFIVTTERDISETIALQKLLEENLERNKKYESELSYLRKQSVENREIVADSRAMKTALRRALKIAKLDTTVLLTGESGTGKEVLANLIYEEGLRKQKPYIKVNCAAIPENLMESEFFGYEKGAFTGADKDGKMGLFELADGGTLFLDEIGDISVMMQAKLLRVLQEQEIMRVGGKAGIPVNVRIITATNKNLKNEIAKNNFREDLYYRLNIFPIDLPPLRERKEDIAGLAHLFIEQFNKKYALEKTISDSAVKALTAYSWPGNIREFRNIIERIMIDTNNNDINKFQIIKHLRTGRFDRDVSLYDLNCPLEEALKSYEKAIILNLMGKYNNASKVAGILRVNKSTISKKMKKYNAEL